MSASAAGARGPLSWPAGDIAAVVGGALKGEGGTIRFVTIDSRSAGPGALFVALPGEQRDGHQFVAGALKAGAGAVLVRRGSTNVTPRIEVDDPQEALLALAVARRAHLTMPVVAITGSTGKTTTKDLAAAALGAGTWASPRSYNNELGVPLTVLGAPGDAAALVVEVGSRGVGHIAHLAPAVRPDVAVLTNLGQVHMETFGTPERLAAAKWELIEALPPDGIAVLPHLETRLGAFSGRRLTFGPDVGDVAYGSVTLDELGRPTFTLSHGGTTATVELPLAGTHQAANAAAAVAAAIAVGVPLSVAVPRLRQVTGSQWRMEVHRGRYTVVNDAYNANPTSTEAALRTVAAMPGRHLAVLGVMAELGPVADAEHRRIGALAAELGFDPVVVVGDAPGLAAGAGEAAHAVAGIDEAVAAVSTHLGPGDVVLVKGSRVVGLERVAARLVADAEEAVA